MPGAKHMSLRIVAASAALLLAGCGWFGGDTEEPVREEDPATTGALGDQIMFDPDLAGQNRADSAAFVPSGDGSVPRRSSSSPSPPSTCCRSWWRANRRRR